MASVSLNLEMYLLFEYAERGAWCDHCLKPSAVKVPSVILNAATFHTVSRSLLCVCVDCGRHTYAFRYPKEDNP